MSIFESSCGGYWVDGRNVCHCPECGVKRAEAEAEDWLRREAEKLGIRLSPKLLSALKDRDGTRDS